MANPSDAGPSLPPGRYGEPRRTPRWVKVLLACGAVVVLVPLAVGIVHRAAPSTSATVTGFDVSAQHRVTATLDVHKPRDRQVVCTVTARDFYSEVVGSGRVTIAAGQPGRVATVAFPTSDKAVAVDLQGCVTSPAP